MVHNMFFRIMLGCCLTHEHLTYKKKCLRNPFSNNINFFYFHFLVSLTFIKNITFNRYTFYSTKNITFIRHTFYSTKKHYFQ